MRSDNAHRHITGRDLSNIFLRVSRRVDAQHACQLLFKGSQARSVFLQLRHELGNDNWRWRHRRRPAAKCKPKSSASPPYTRIFTNKRAHVYGTMQLRCLTAEIQIAKVLQRQPHVQSSLHGTHQVDQSLGQCYRVALHVNTKAWNGRQQLTGLASHAATASAAS